MRPETYAALLRRGVPAQRPVSRAHWQHRVQAWIHYQNYERTITMTQPDILSDLTDHDRRWLVHIFAALTNGIQDEIEYDAIAYHDESIYDDRERFNTLYSYVYNALTWCMQQAHAEEAAVVQAETDAYGAAHRRQVAGEEQG
jgi:hypothetical protein